MLYEGERPYKMKQMYFASSGYQGEVRIFTNGWGGGGTV